MLKVIQRIVNNLYTCRFKDFDTNPIYAVRNGRKLYISIGMSRKDFYNTQIRKDFTDPDWVFRICGVFVITHESVVFKYYLNAETVKIDMADLSNSEYGRLCGYLSLLSQVVGISDVNDWHADYEGGVL